MSLYDDDDAALPETANAVTGWSKSVAWMQSQQKQTLATKKANSNSASRMRGIMGAGAPIEKASLAPVVNLQKSKKSNQTNDRPSMAGYPFIGEKIGGEKVNLPLNDPQWTVVNEYDPLWPNDYHKVIQEIRDSKRQNDDDLPESKKRRYSEAGRERARERFRRDGDAESGFSRRPNDDYSDDDEDERGRSSSRRSGSHRRRNDRNSGSSHSSSSAAMGGATIAPPPSLTESSESSLPSSSSPSASDSNASPMSVQKLGSTPAGSIPGLGVAAKIMAKYGYKHGQGLGRSEQGMSQALSVEKTSKRGGRIIHEKDLMPPPPLFGETSTTPPHVTNDNTEEEEAQVEGQKPSITDLMKNPSKVVICKNMVGPGEVDDDLEPEVKEECNTKYGDVNKVVIFELQNVAPEEAVRIFIEFKRVESAIKAVVDLNGRFFGGREVAASFYDVDKFMNLQLTD